MNTEHTCLFSLAIILDGAVNSIHINFVHDFLSLRKNTELFFVYIRCLVGTSRTGPDSGHANRLIATEKSAVKEA